MTDREEHADEPETPETPGEDASEKAPKKKTARKTSKARATKKAAPKKAAKPADEGEPQAVEVEAEPFDATTPPIKGERTVKAKAPTKTATKASETKASDPGAAGTADAPGTPEPAPNGDLAGRAWCMTCHLSTLVAFGIPVLVVGFLGPIFIGLLMKVRYPEVEHHSKEAINFQLNFLLWNVLAYLMTMSCLLSCLGPPLAVLLPVANIALTILAGLKASEGEKFRYPYTIRIIGPARGR